jgi:succinoglycan biosynthesis protein ExoA
MQPPDGTGNGAVDCSILVPVYNEERYIEQSVAAMLRQRFDGSLEFLFADGGSSDRTKPILEELARQDPRIRIFDNPRRTVTSGLNVALGHARGRWVARMDAHTEYPDEYVARGVARLERGGTTWVSGPQVPRGDNVVSRAIALALRSPLGRGGSRKWGIAGAGDTDEFEVDSGVFAGVWERATLLAYHGWDERWVVNEDSELAGRFLAHGERLVCLPTMGADYAPRRTLGGLWHQYYAYGQHRAHTAARHPQTMRRSQVLPPAIAIDTALALIGPRRLRAPARAGLGCYTAALAWATATPLRSERDREAVLVPIVLVVMHYAHGAGFIRGAARYGPPLAALASIAGLSGLAGSLSQAGDTVCNPSLRSQRDSPP